MPSASPVSRATVRRPSVSPSMMACAISMTWPPRPWRSSACAARSSLSPASRPTPTSRRVPRSLGQHGGIPWPRIKELAARGHEIANHSWSHAGLMKLDDAQLDDEINKAYDRIAERIGAPPLTFCYPGNGAQCARPRSSPSAPSGRSGQLLRLRRYQRHRLQRTG